MGVSFGASRAVPVGEPRGTAMGSEGGRSPGGTAKGEMRHKQSFAG